VQKPLQAIREIGIPAKLSHYSFCTNGSHFAGEAGIPTIGFGPSQENLAHTDNEYIELDQLTQAVEGFAAIMRALLIEK
jgi:acetylornithine deacetylase/succinyl-diaminopimelate desuccinylase-like protein